MKIRIKNLRLRTIVGVYGREQKNPQEVVVNVEMETDGHKAAESDDLTDSVDYKALKLRLLEEVQNSRYKLLERLASHVLKMVLSDDKVLSATVEVDKPHALRFADSVSVVCTGQRRP
ncbi:MAG: dihydroneopterin aldolase [Phycisphaerae bacterium]